MQRVYSLFATVTGMGYASGMSTTDDDLRAATRIPISLGRDARKAAGRAATRAGLPMATWIASLVTTWLHDQGHMHNGQLVEP